MAPRYSPRSYAPREPVDHWEEPEPVDFDPQPSRPSAGDYLWWTVCIFLTVSFGTATYQVWQQAGRQSTAGRPSTDMRASAGSLTDRDAVRILVLGSDGVKGNSRADTMIVATLYPQTHRLTLLSIPRDSRVSIPGHGLDKINAAYSYGGVQLAVHTLQSSLGLPRIEYYVECDFDGFKKLVDALGGVELEVEKDMKYTDNAQNLRIDLRAGKQRLQGYEAMCYVRYRGDGRGDIGRIARQQKFIRALLAELLKVSTLPRAPGLLRALPECVSTNLEARQLYALGRALLKVRPGDVLMESLPGESRNIGGRSYWVVHPAEMTAIRRELHAKAVARGDRPPAVEVLNGCGVKDAAGSVARLLEEQGYEVVRTGNADSFDHEQSTICTYDPRSQVGPALKRVLKCGTLMCVNCPTTDVSATIVVGRDLNPTLLSQGAGGKAPA